MAGVTRAEQLQAFRNVAAEVAAGRMGAAEARQAMREALAAQGYQARPGEEGSIKDLSSTRRLQVAIDTNVELARGWSQRQTSLQNYVRPAQELYRAGEAKKPRDWQSLWGQAAEAVGWEGVSPTRPFVALKTSPIWRALSRFDQPYPPFDFGSHMRVRSVTLAAARDAGLLSSEEEAAEAREKQRKEALASLNENVECTPQVTERELREQLAGVLQGLAEWRGNTLVMTDPNGTRPYPPEEIGAIITAPLPQGFENRQAKVADKWIDDNTYLYPEEHGGKATRDEREDFMRLLDRIIPTTKNGGSDTSAETVYRGLTRNSESKREDMVHDIRRKGYGAREGFLAESWTTSPTAAAHFADSPAPVVLVCNKYQNRKRIDALYNHLRDSSPNVTKPKRLEGESLFAESSRFRFIRQEQKENVLYIYVEEITH